MIKRFLIFVFALLSITSCYKFNKPEKPKHLISKEKMVNILMDIRLISAANGANKNVLQKQNLLEETYIYKKHNIDSMQFAESNAYYSYFVEDYEAIYAKVQDSLEALKKKFDELVVVEQKEKDSLSKVKKQRKPVIETDPIRAARDSIKIIRENNGLIKPVSDSEKNVQ